MCGCVFEIGRVVYGVLIPMALWMFTARFSFQSNYSNDSVNHLTTQWIILRKTFP